MDVACPSLPLNVLTGDKLRPVPGHTPGMAADGCHLATCSLYVLLVIIEISSSPCVIMSSREVVLYKTGPPILSRTFLKTIREASITMTLVELPHIMHTVV
jgi:hypothetical protein